MVTKTGTLRKLANIFFIVCMSMVSVLLVWIVLLRLDNYDSRQTELEERSIKAAATEVNLLIKGYQRSIRIFADENKQLLASLAAWPQDIDQYTLLENKITKYFPEHFTFTLSNLEGSTLLEGFEGMVGERCRRDIHTFLSSNGQSNVHIHKGPEGVPLHFDIMAPWSADTSPSGVFFVSFKTDTLERMLDDTRVAGFRTMLVRQDDPEVVDMISQGGNIQPVSDTTIHPVDTNRFTLSIPIDGTLWDIVILPDDNRRSRIYRSILTQALLLFAGFLVVSLIMRMMLLDEE